MKLMMRCLFSPKLYKVYRDGTTEHSFYQTYGLEKLGSKVLSSIHTLWSIGLYTSPFICLYLYKQGYPNAEQAKFLACCISGLGCVIAMSYIARAIGRANNPQYVSFVNTLYGSKRDMRAYLTELRKYDFEYSAWPVTYSMFDPSRRPPKNVQKWHKTEHRPIYQRVPLRILAFIAIHTFGLRLVYPGTLALIHYLLESALLQGRSDLVEGSSGLRAKIETVEGNHIDTMFVDQRHYLQGKNLVVCCEGNSGFYEVGIMTTPIKAGYSALGWNHPGFATSTGTPFPDQEQNAIDAVMQYAIHELGFKPRDIILFGWSIGGYTATWAAANYPEIKALILDATFDDLLPLALNQMPRSWGPLVEHVIRGYVDLNVGKLIAGYSGPVQLVRRTEDEIICLRPGQLSSNRGNNLLLDIIKARHPDVDTHSMRKYVGLLDTQRAALLSTIGPDGKDYELLRLINKYLRDYKSSHCTPLPKDDFEQIVKNITTQHDYD